MFIFSNKRAFKAVCHHRTQGIKAQAKFRFNLQKVIVQKHAPMNKNRVTHVYNSVRN